MTYLAIDYHGQGVFKPRSYEPVAPGPDEVSIAVAFTGICGTDIKIAHGAMDHRVTAPWPIGHEMSGTIESLGRDVTDWHVGDNVTVMPLEWCGHCSACLRGHNHVCQNLVFVGIDSPGSLQQRWNVPARLLVRVPDELSLKQAALAEPTAVAVHDVRRAGVTTGDQVVIIGGGPIGILIGLVAVHEGAEVLLSEVSPFRRDIASALGLRTLDPLNEDLHATVSTWSEGKGADVAFEVSGSAPGVRALTDVLCVRGRGVVVAIHTEPTPVDLMAAFWKELDIRGARVYQRQDFESGVALLARGIVPAESFITQVVALSNLEGALEQLASGGETVKVLIDSR